MPVPLGRHVVCCTGALHIIILPLCCCAVTSRCIHRHAHSKASEENFLESPQETTEIISLLEKFLTCKDKDGSSHKTYISRAQSQIAKLKAFSANISAVSGGP
jgi:hypothetical protein